MTDTYPARTRLTRAVSVGAAALLAVALGGCIKMDIRLALEGEQASGEMLIGVDKQFLEFVSSMEGGDGPSARDQFLEDLLGDDLAQSEGVTVEPWEDDTYEGARYQFEGTDLAEFQGGSADDLAITYDRAAATYEVTGRFDMRELAEQPDPAEAEELGMPPEMLEQLLDSFDISISITFPGEVVEHNGELSDTTVTWRPEVGEENEIYALASSVPSDSADEDAGALTGAGGGSSSLTTSLLVALGVLVLATAVVLGIWFARRTRPVPAGEAATAEQPTVGFPPPPGTPQPPSSPPGGYQPPGPPGSGQSAR